MPNARLAQAFEHPRNDSLEVGLALQAARARRVQVRPVDRRNRPRVLPAQREDFLQRAQLRRPAHGLRAQVNVRVARRVQRLPNLQVSRRCPRHRVLPAPLARRARMKDHAVSPERAHRPRRREEVALVLRVLLGLLAGQVDVVGRVDRNLHPGAPRRLADRARSRLGQAHAVPRRILIGRQALRREPLGRLHALLEAFLVKAVAVARHAESYHGSPPMGGTFERPPF